MRLTKVRVTKLFGLFDHEIPLNREERITIIHGPNGFGKTIVLRMIAALMSGQYELFSEVSFEKFSIEFDDGQSLSVERTDNPAYPGRERKLPNLTVDLAGPEQLSWSLSAAINMLEQIGEAVKASDVYYRVLSHGKRQVLSAVPLSELSPPEGTAPQPRKSGLERFEPEWLSRARVGFPRVRLVRTQRLDVVEHEQKDWLDVPIPTVEAYSRDLSSRIRQALAEYASRSQELDRSFPTRLLRPTKAEPPGAEELRNRLSGLEQKRSVLTRLGFLDPEQGLTQASVQEIESKREVLAVYVDDMGSKLALFDEMVSKIQLFTRIVNERFLFKRLETHRDQGFVITSTTGARLGPSELSAGEQHELILLYELLFKLEKNALVLIDEPEISLHVAWQEKFLSDLMEVVKLSEIDVVVATHSPEIIGEHWGLTVELKGPSEIRKD